MPYHGTEYDFIPIKVKGDKIAVHDMNLKWGVKNALLKPHTNCRWDTLILSFIKLLSSFATPYFSEPEGSFLFTGVKMNFQSEKLLSAYWGSMPTYSHLVNTDLLIIDSKFPWWKNSITIFIISNHTYGKNCKTGRGTAVQCVFQCHCLLDMNTQALKST